MAERIRRTEYYYTMIPDTPGEGARVLGALSSEGVNLLACHAFPEGGQTQMDFVPSDPAALRQGAQAAGIDLTGPKTVLLIEGDDRPGAGAELLSRLAEAEVNAVAMDAIVVGDRYGQLLWVDEADLEKASQALGAG